jgi:SAM-dependent methyltransferase
MQYSSLLAAPVDVASLDDCYFYHVMDIPGHGVTTGEWDLRGRVDEYLGQFAFAGKRVLEIGPASGFLTFELEKRGAKLVALEVTDDPGWDFVPYPTAVLSNIYGPRREHMRRLKNSFWFAHAAHRSNAELIYGDAYRLPDALGDFDVAVMASVLLHCHSPLAIIEQCARRSNALIIVDVFTPRLEGAPVCELIPTAENRIWDAWWRFSTDCVIQYCEVLGFCNIQTSIHAQMYGKRPVKLFTIVATKGQRNDNFGFRAMRAAKRSVWRGFRRAFRNRSGTE